MARLRPSYDHLFYSDPVNSTDFISKFPLRPRSFLSSDVLDYAFAQYLNGKEDVAKSVLRSVMDTPGDGPLPKVIRPIAKEGLAEMEKGRTKFLRLVHAYETENAARHFPGITLVRSEDITPGVETRNSDADAIDLK